ncbi:MAG TPA: STAS domain-containing protein [Solirubrobacteraceae bacterium]|nr:STAS domain-containing protein [Solirubrobacteraceae bacterium]
MSGELDLATAPRLNQVRREAEVCPQRVLDLRELTFTDSAGIHVILEANARAKADGDRLVLVRGPSQVDRVFALTGAAEALEIVDLARLPLAVMGLVGSEEEGGR